MVPLKGVKSLFPKERKAPTFYCHRPLNSPQSLSQLQTASKQHCHPATVTVGNHVPPPAPIKTSQRDLQRTHRHIYDMNLKNAFYHIIWSFHKYLLIPGLWQVLSMQCLQWWLLQGFYYITFSQVLCGHVILIRWDIDCCKFIFMLIQWLRNLVLIVSLRRHLDFLNYKNQGQCRHNWKKNSHEIRVMSLSCRS